MDQKTQLKEHLVNKFYLIIILGVLFISCKTEIKQNDYLLINKIIKQTKEQDLDKTLVFKLNNSNEYVIAILNELNKYEINNERHKLDSLKRDLGIIGRGINYIDRDEILDKVFNKSEYYYLISQKDNSQWDLNLIDKFYLEKSNNNYSKTLQLSKPIYTSNNEIALVCINRVTSISVCIYTNVKGKWKEYKLIAPLIVQPKAEKFNY